MPLMSSNQQLQIQRFLIFLLLFQPKQGKCANQYLVDGNFKDEIKIATIPKIRPAIAIQATFKRTPKMFIAKPDLSRSRIEIIPMLNTIALGGVATGKLRKILSTREVRAKGTHQKANEQLMQVGTIKNKGLIRMATPIEATMGSIIDATAYK